MNLKRIRVLNDKPTGAGPVVYWMSRDQRLKDNWALIYAAEEAKRRAVPLAVIFCLAPSFLGATGRQYRFMLKGLQELDEHARGLGIHFHVLVGEPAEEIPSYVHRHHVGLLVTDFSPLRIGRTWRSAMAKKTDAACVEVDAHNIIPCWLASDHQEFAARTIRPKIHRLLPEFLDAFPKHPAKTKSWPDSSSFQAQKILSEQLSKFSGEGEGYGKESGEVAALKTLRSFLKTRLHGYDEQRNDPTLDGQSGLSAYLHFGQLSAQRVACGVQAAEAPSKDKEAFLEELIVRRELAENFCFYNSHYDSVKGFPEWAKKELDAHRKDKRPFVYTSSEFEQAKTHDRLWNACQREMILTGKMHGYMRMYWAKKILEWTKAPEDAMRIAIHLNDTYELDGRDPNGYTGIAWSIGGVHDRPWFPRPIFGTIRYMNDKGAASKFDVDAYIARWT